MSKRKFNDDFESIYLREATMNRIAITPDHSALLTTTENQKIFNYLCNYHWSKDSRFWQRVGIETDDLLNMVRLYGLYYIALQSQKGSSINNTNMMRYINQRLEYFGRCFHRKYALSEIISESGTEIETIQTTDPFVDNVEPVPDDTPKPPIRINQKRRRILKNKISQNIDEYKNILVYYAVSKHVCKDVRKKARRYCKTYGINYKEIAEDTLLEKEPLHYTLD